MPVTQSVTPTPEEAGTSVPVSGIDNNFDEQGHQEGADDLFEFDQEVEAPDETPIVTPAPGDEIVDETPVTPTDPATPPVKTPEEEGLEGVRVDKPVDPAKPAEVKPTEEAKPAETELKVYAGKFKSVQELKNSFVQLGGDPAKFGDKVEMLEEAYRVRQTEFSKSRAEIAAATEVPLAPPKTVEELMQSEFGEVDPAAFKDPAEMWQTMMKGFGNVLNNVQGQKQAPSEQVSPMEMDRQIKSLNNMHEIETKVPRLKTDENFRKGFASHIMLMKQEGRNKEINPGVLDINYAMQDYIKGQSALVEEANKAYKATEAAKAVSTAVSTDNAPSNPALSPSNSPEDDILDGILEAQAADAKKYN